jgi:hypothetical protein
MALENGTQEKIRVPKDAKEMIEEYLTYKDLGSEMKEVERDFYIQAAERSEEKMKYAEALRQSAEKFGIERLLNIATEIRQGLRYDARQLNLPLQRTAHSSSWALFALGEKLYRASLPKEDPKHKDGEPLSSREDQADILRERLGVEGYRAFYQDKWHEIAENNPRLTDAMPFLIKHPGTNSQLSTEDNLELGRVLHRVANQIIGQKMGMSEEEAKSEKITEISEEKNKTVQNLEKAAENLLAVTEKLNARLDQSAEEDEEDDEEDGEDEIHEEHTTLHESHAVPQTARQVQAHARVENVRKGVTPGGIIYAAALAPFLGAGAVAGVAVVEFVKTSWQSIKGMFGVLKNLAKNGFSFKSLNQGVQPEKGGQKSGHDAQGGDHGKEHAQAEHGHDDHGGGHADQGHAVGGHAKKKSRGKKKKAGGGAHH